MADDIKHPQLRPDWQRPAPPAGFDELVCCMFADGSFDLDFVNNARRDFASEVNDQMPMIHSPWREGFLAEKDDWRVIGIDVIDFG